MGDPPNNVGSTRSGGRLSAANTTEAALASISKPTACTFRPNHAEDIIAACSAASLYASRTGAQAKPMIELGNSNT